MTRHKQFCKNGKWGHRPTGGRKYGILKIRVRFPLAPLRM